jgi:hypothetical protein
VATLRRIAPILPVRDLAVSFAHYQLLGFTMRLYEGGGYGYAVRDGIEIHLGVLADADRSVGASAYLWVEDADALAQAWRSAGVELHLPRDTAWRQREEAVVDPDGNVIRFGSPMQ